MLNTKLLSLAVITTISLGVVVTTPKNTNAESVAPQLVKAITVAEASTGAGSGASTTSQSGVDVTKFGAVSDANYYNSRNGNYYKDQGFTQPATDSTQAINAAIRHAKENNITNIIIPSGNFLIDAEGKKAGYDFERAVNGGIQMESNTSLLMNKDTKLVTNTVHTNGYSLITINHKENVKVSGGVLVGDINTHAPNNHVYCHGMTISHGSRNITVEDTEIREMEDDGIMIADYLGHLSGGRKVDNVVIKNVKSHTNGRQGLTISTGKNIKVVNSEFSNQRKHSPMSGIDIELESFDHEGVKNVEIIGNTFNNNAYSGVVISDMFNDRPLTMSNNVNISNNNLNNNRFGVIAAGKVTGLNITNNNVTIDHLLNEFSTAIGSTSPESRQVNIENNKVTSGNKDNYSLGIINISPASIIKNNILKGQRKGIVLYCKGSQLISNAVEARLINVEGR